MHKQNNRGQCRITTTQNSTVGAKRRAQRATRKADSGHRTAQNRQHTADSAKSLFDASPCCVWGKAHLRGVVLHFEREAVLRAVDRIDAHVVRALAGLPPEVLHLDLIPGGDQGHLMLGDTHCIIIRGDEGYLIRRQSLQSEVFHLDLVDAIVDEQSSKEEAAGGDKPGDVVC